MREGLAVTQGAALTSRWRSAARESQRGPPSRSISFPQGTLNFQRPSSTFSLQTHILYLDPLTLREP